MTEEKLRCHLIPAQPGWFVLAPTCDGDVVDEYLKYEVIAWRLLVGDDGDMDEFHPPMPIYAHSGLTSPYRHVILAPNGVVTTTDGVTFDSLEDFLHGDDHRDDAGHRIRYEPIKQI